MSGGSTATPNPPQAEESILYRLQEEILSKLSLAKDAAHRFPPSMRFITLLTITLVTLIAGVILSKSIGRRRRNGNATAMDPSDGSIPVWCPSQEDV